MHQRAFDSSWTAFTADGARWLVDHTDIRLIGIDYLSVATMADLTGPHDIILGAVRPLMSSLERCCCCAVQLYIIQGEHFMQIK